jgi:hypothetical protein
LELASDLFFNLDSCAPRLLVFTSLLSYYESTPRGKKYT